MYTYKYIIYIKYITNDFNDFLQLDFFTVQIDLDKISQLLIKKTQFNLESFADSHIGMILAISVKPEKQCNNNEISAAKIRKTKKTSTYNYPPKSTSTCHDESSKNKKYTLLNEYFT